MKGTLNRLLAVGLFAVAMAYIESAVVVYLRAAYGIEDLLQDLPSAVDRYTLIEIGREMATLVMLATIGYIAGKQRYDRIGYAVYAFGLWDIFYYSWLAVFIGWPTSLLDWDLLFLIPLPWWGPVFAPMLIAMLMIAGGAAAILHVESGKTPWLTPYDWLVLGAALLLVLYVFMSDAIGALPAGTDALVKVRPTEFNWNLFGISLAGFVFFISRIIGFRLVTRRQ